MHDRTKLTHEGWQDGTLRLSDHWNNSREMTAEEFLSDLYKFNDRIPSHFYLSILGHSDTMKLDLALQKSLYAPTQRDDEEEPQFKDNREKFEILVDAAASGLDFDAAFIWHNKRSGKCSLGEVGQQGWIHRTLLDLSDITVNQMTLWTSKPVENNTHWTVAKYSKQRNMWVVQDTKPKGEYEHPLQRAAR
jgi:hypothetical protein